MGSVSVGTLTKETVTVPLYRQYAERHESVSQHMLLGVLITKR